MLLAALVEGADGGGFSRDLFGAGLALLGERDGRKVGAGGNGVEQLGADFDGGIGREFKCGEDGAVVNGESLVVVEEVKGKVVVGGGDEDGLVVEGGATGGGGADGELCCRCGGLSGLGGADGPGEGDQRVGVGSRVGGVGDADGFASGDVGERFAGHGAGGGVGTDDQLGGGEVGDGVEIAVDIDESRSGLTHDNNVVFGRFAAAGVDVAVDSDSGEDDGADNEAADQRHAKSAHGEFGGLGFSGEHGGDDSAGDESICL